MAGMTLGTMATAGTDQAGTTHGTMVTAGTDQVGMTLGTQVGMIHSGDPATIRVIIQVTIPAITQASTLAVTPDSILQCHLIIYTEEMSTMENVRTAALPSTATEMAAAMQEEMEMQT